MIRQNAAPPSALFLTLSLLISAIFWALIISAGHVGAAAGMYASGLMWSPAMAAVLTVYLRNQPYADLGLRWCGAPYALFGYLLPLGYAGFADGMVWILRLGTLPGAAGIAALSHRLGSVTVSRMRSARKSAGGVSGRRDRSRAWASGERVW